MLESRRFTFYRRRRFRLLCCSEPLEQRQMLTGDPSFLTTFGGIDHDTINDVAIGPGGDAYVTGTFSNSVDFEPGPGKSGKTAPAGPDTFVARYSGVDGSLVWVSHFAALSTDSVGSMVAGNGIAVDAAGGVYVTGNFQNNVDFDEDGVPETSDERDVFVARLDAADGGLSWLRLGSGGRSAQELAIGPSGDVFVAGSYRDESFELGGHVLPGSPTEGHLTTFVARIDPVGNVEWLNGFAANGSNGSRDIDVSSTGIVHVVGDVDGTINFGKDASGIDVIANATNATYAAQLSGDGTVNWFYIVEPATGSSARFADVATDSLGNVFVTGNFYGPVDFDPTTIHPMDDDLPNSASRDGFVLQLNADGTFQQVASMGGEGADGLSDVAIGPYDNVYVVGAFGRSALIGGVQLEGEGAGDGFVAALDNSLKAVWVEQIVGESAATDIVLDAQGNLFVAGSFSASPLFPTADLPVSAGLSDAFFLKWNPALPSLAGNVFADLNADGARNDDNRAIPAGWVVYLDDNQNGQRDIGEPLATTFGNTGNFTFGQLPAGSYTVAQEVQIGWTQSAPLASGQPVPHSVTLADGIVSPRLDIGNSIPIQTHSVSSSDVPKRIKRTDPVHSTLTFDDPVPGSETFIVDVDLTANYVDKDSNGKHVFIDLVSPSQTTVSLVSSGTTVFDVDAVFDDEGDAATAFPLTGTIKPLNGFLSELDGQSAAGTWTLVTQRLWSGREAILNSWSIDVTLAIIPPGPPNQPPIADAGPHHPVMRTTSSPSTPRLLPIQTVIHSRITGILATVSRSKRPIPS